MTSYLKKLLTSGGSGAIIIEHPQYARVVELADSLDSGSSVHYARAGSSPASRTTSEQSPLCSGVFLCLRQKRRHPPAPLLLLSNCDPLRWARSWVSFPVVASVTSLALTFIHSEKSQAALVSLPFLSKLNPLRWASILFFVHLYAQMP